MNKSIPLLVAMLFYVMVGKSATYFTTAKTNIWPKNTVDTIPSIDSAMVKKHLYTISSDAMEGRKPGTPGMEKATKYIESFPEEFIS